MDNVLIEIKTEREYQDNRWGHDTDDTLNTPWMWVAYITQYAGNWMRGAFAPLASDDVELFRKSMVKVAALAVAAIQSIDRQRAQNGRTFFEKDAA